MHALQLPRPYLLFLGDSAAAPFAKTAFGLRDWIPEQCVGECALPGTMATTGLPRLTPSEAHGRGARGLVVGVAPIGGAISTSWIPMLLDALEAGLDVISGMHSGPERVPELQSAAERLGRLLINVRKPPTGIPIATGRKRSGKRLLTVGTDCALGKKYTALTIARSLLRRGISADFRASGQTGILIAGRGIPIDAVVADFVAGAAEVLSPDAAEDHWDVIEGQGSLFHPSYAGVSLGLLHGSQPDVIVLCHELGRERVLGLADFALPDLRDAIDLNLVLARRTNSRVRCAGISLNTSRLAATDASVAIEAMQARFGMPCADPIRGGPAFDRLVDACLEDLA